MFKIQGEFFHCYCNVGFNQCLLPKQQKIKAKCKILFLKIKMGDICNGLR